MTYAVKVHSRARKALRQLDRREAAKILAAMRALADDPRPPNAEPLQGASFLKIRIGTTGSSTTWTTTRN